MNVVYDSEGIFYELQLNTPKYQVSGDRPAMIAKQLMMSPQIEAIGGLYPHCQGVHPKANQGWRFGVRRTKKIAPSLHPCGRISELEPRSISVA